MIKRTVAYLFAYIGFILLAGCGSLQDNQTVGFSKDSAYNHARFSNSDTVKDKLYAQYNEWRGVRYRIGGLSRRGIDCSGFVLVTFKSRFGLDLPRTTRFQSNLGRKINRSELKAGDLVFFKTGSISRHVGIYLENGKFLHASSSKGVIISKLNNVYWKSNYWKSIRI